MDKVPTRVFMRIDHRECAIKPLITSLLERENINYSLENLECGDFIIEVDGQPLLVIERKTIKDLLASIKDGRLRDQKRKMIEQYDKSKIMYLIEGVLSFQEMPKGFTDVEYKSLKSSVINTQVRDKVTVMQTNNLQETCAYLYDVVYRVYQNPSKYCLETTGELLPIQQPISLNGAIKKKTTRNEVFIQQLCQVSGISHKTAEAISREFIDMKTFYESLLPLDNEQKLKLLKNIYLKDNRRINSKVADTIVQYMF